MQTSVEELWPYFKAEDVYETPRGRVFATRVDRERPNDFGGLMGSEVLISWQGEAAVYKVVGIDRFAHGGPRYPGEHFGLLAERVNP